jgi:hypothetical protein
MVKVMHLILTKDGLGYILGNFFTNSYGANFSYIFSAENHFPQKIPWNLLKKMIFQNFFRGKLQFFPTFFWGGEFSAEFSLEKM